MPKATHPRGPLPCEELVGDVLGVRVLCKTKRDITLFVQALDRACEAGELDRHQVKDFRPGGQPAPKPSGYRAYHSDLATHLTVGGEQSAVGWELQVKTHLQLAWGELTHEDLYKPGDVKYDSDSFHSKIGRSMAGMLDAVDDLADELAVDLSRRLAQALQSVPATDSAGEALTPTESVEAEIVAVKPNFALAIADGERGLIPAVAVKQLLIEAGRIPPGTYVDVDDYLEVGTRIAIRVVEEGRKRFYYPIDASALGRP